MAESPGDFTKAVQRAQHMMKENPFVKLSANVMMTSRGIHIRATDMLNQHLLELHLEDPTGISDALQGLSRQYTDSNPMSIATIRENLVTVLLPYLDVLEKREQALSAQPPANGTSKKEDNGIIKPN